MRDAGWSGDSAVDAGHSTMPWPTSGTCPYRYSAYGIGIGSELPLPGVESCPQSIGATVRVAPLAEITAELQARDTELRVTRREVQLLLPQIGTLIVRNGREVLVDPSPDADPQLLRLAIIGPALAALLKQRGMLVLHASAVEIGGVAVAFMGMSGAGKSTLAAALHQRGHAVLADDYIAVLHDAGTIRLLAGLPQMSLWPDSLAALGEPADLPPGATPGGKRTVLTAEAEVPTRAPPLGCLFVLSTGDVPAIDPLTPHEAFLQIVIHTYGAQWLYSTPDARLFQERADLVRRIPVQRLQRPFDFTRVPEVIRMVEESLAAG